VSTLLESLVLIALERDLTPDEAISRAVAIVRELELAVRGATEPIPGDIAQLHPYVLATTRTHQRPLVVATRALQAWQKMEIARANPAIHPARRRGRGVGLQRPLQRWVHEQTLETIDGAEGLGTVGYDGGDGLGGCDGLG